MKKKKKKIQKNNKIRTASLGVRAFVGKLFNPSTAVHEKLIRKCWNWQLVTRYKN